MTEESAEGDRGEETDRGRAASGRGAESREQQSSRAAEQQCSRAAEQQRAAESSREQEGGQKRVQKMTEEKRPTGAGRHRAKELLVEHVQQVARCQAVVLQRSKDPR